MADGIAKLLGTPEGIAVVVVGCAALLYFGTDLKVSAENLFRVGRSYDFRNGSSVVQEKIPQSDPFSTGITSVSSQLKRDVVKQQ